MSSASKRVWPWEVAVLQEKYGGAVEVHGEAVEERENAPDAETEYRRLNANHGFEPTRGVSYAEMVYGRGAAGIAALDKEIQKACGKKAAAKLKTKAAPVASKEPDAGKDEPDDPLG